MWNEMCYLAKHVISLYCCECENGRILRYQYKWFSVYLPSFNVGSLNQSVKRRQWVNTPVFILSLVMVAELPVIQWADQVCWSSANICWDQIFSGLVVFNTKITYLRKFYHHLLNMQQYAVPALQPLWNSVGKSFSVSKTWNFCDLVSISRIALQWWPYVIFLSGEVVDIVKC